MVVRALTNVEHPRNLAVKFLVLGLFIFTALPIVGRVPASDRWIIAIVTSMITYLLGDMLILPRLGTDWSAVIDGFLIAISVWVVAGLLVTPTVTLGAALTLGLLGGIIEWLFHHLLRQTAPTAASLRNPPEKDDQS